MAALIKRCVLGLWFIASLTHASNKSESVKDLRYGIALYWYYQGDYMQALTELLVAEKQGGIEGHGVDPEIMKGGFSLGYGMERTANAIFEKQLKENRSRDSQDAAWFFISKLRYLREDWQGAEDALNKVREKPAEAIRDDVYAHRVSLAIRQNQLENAQKILKKNTPSKDWLPYLYFNFGAAYARNADYKHAVEYFEKLTQDEYSTDELRALYDKAMTSSGYAYLLDKQYAQAIKQFSKVRLTSAFSNKALLGYGWAAVELEDYKEALKPWIHLSKSTFIDENSQEALIAVPYAYEKLEQKNLALEGFKTAELKFLSEMDKLNSVIKSMEGQQLLNAFKIKRSEGLDWLKYVRDSQVTPQLGYLAELFAQEEFQGLVQELRDLVGIKEDLETWQEKLAFYGELVVERERNRVSQSQKVVEQEFRQRIDEMTTKRNTFAQKIEKIIANDDYFLLANADEKDLIDRAVRSKKNITALKNTDPFIDENEEAVRRYYGILYWNASETYSDRVWALTKNLTALDQILAELKKNQSSVQTIMDASEDLTPFKERIRDGQDRVEIELARIQLAIDFTSDKLRNQTLVVLDRQKERLNHYIAQSRLSKARLLDQALQADLYPEPDENNEEDISPHSTNNKAMSDSEGATEEGNK